MKAECGHTFCRNCIREYGENNLADKYAAENMKSSCPECHKEYTEFCPNFQLKETILREIVFCDYKNNMANCSWKGTVTDWEQNHSHDDLVMLQLILKNRKERLEKERRAHQDHIIIQLSQSSQNNHGDNSNGDDRIFDNSRPEREYQNLLQERGPSSR